jgi:HlyD family secretion protein
MSKKKKKWLLIGGGALVLIIIIGNIIGGGELKQTVQVEETRHKDLTATVTATGRVVAKDEVTISAEVSARVLNVYVEEGDAVAKGDVLVRMESSTYAAAVSQFEASLSSSRAQLRVAEANLEHSELLMHQQEELYARGLVSHEQYDATSTSYEINKAQVDAARDQVAQAQARLEQSRRELAKTVITAPRDGVVIGVRVREGETVVGALNYTGTELLTVADLSVMQVEADVDETDVAFVEEGQLVEVNIDAFPDSTFSGVVTEVGHRGSILGGSGGQTITNFPVEIEITNASSGVLSGMTAEVEITTATRDSALVVPLSSLVLRSPRDTIVYDNPSNNSDQRRDRERRDFDDEEEPLEGVFVVSEGEVLFRMVTKGIADDQDVEILSGLAPGDTVVTGPYRALRRLRAGEQVDTERSWMSRRNGDTPSEE